MVECSYLLGVVRWIPEWESVQLTWIELLFGLEIAPSDAAVAPSDVPMELVESGVGDLFLEKAILSRWL